MADSSSDSDEEEDQTTLAKGSLISAVNGGAGAIPKDSVSKQTQP